MLPDSYDACDWCVHQRAGLRTRIMDGVAEFCDGQKILRYSSPAENFKTMLPDVTILTLCIGICTVYVYIVYVYIYSICITI